MGRLQYEAPACGWCLADTSGWLDAGADQVAATGAGRYAGKTCGKELWVTLLQQAHSADTAGPTSEASHGEPGYMCQKIGGHHAMRSAAFFSLLLQLQSMQPASGSLLVRCCACAAPSSSLYDCRQACRPPPETPAFQNLGCSSACSPPVVPGCVMISSKPPAATATTGSPLAMASRATNPAGPEQEIAAHSACCEPCRSQTSRCRRCRDRARAPKHSPSSAGAVLASKQWHQLHVVTKGLSL